MESSVAAIATPLSPALCRLLNAALIDPLFQEELVQAPRRAATRAALAPELAFGCRLPDPALRLPAIAFEPSDWDRLGRAGPSASLAEMCSQLVGGSPDGSLGSLTPDSTLLVAPREADSLAARRLEEAG